MLLVCNNVKSVKKKRLLPLQNLLFHSAKIERKNEWQKCFSLNRSGVFPKCAGGNPPTAVDMSYQTAMLSLLTNWVVQSTHGRHR